MALAFGAGFGLLLLADLVDGFVAAKLSIAFVLVFWVPMIALHELGHALAARLLGWRVVELSVGIGRPLTSWQLGDTHVTLRLFPAGGYVVPAPVDPKPARLRSAWVYAAGPGIELLLAAGVGALVGWETLLSPSESTGIIACQSLALTATMGAVFNLVPLPSGGAVTDGLGMLLSLQLPPEAFAQRATLPFVTRAERALDAAEAEQALAAVDEGLGALPEHPRLESLRAVCLAAAGRSDDAIELLERLRERELSPTEEADALHAAARVVLESGDHAQLADAEHACRAAIDMRRDEPAYPVTLGALLLEQQRCREACATLLPLAGQCGSDPLDNRCLATLALAAHGAGEPGHAALYAEELARRRPGVRLWKQVSPLARSFKERAK